MSNIYKILLIFANINIINLLSLTFSNGIKYTPININSCTNFKEINLIFDNKNILNNGYNYNIFASDLYNLSANIDFLYLYDYTIKYDILRCINDLCVKNINNYVSWKPSDNNFTNFKIKLNDNFYTPFLQTKIPGNIKLVNSFKKDFFFFNYVIEIIPLKIFGNILLSNPISSKIGCFNFLFTNPCMFILKNTIIEIKRPVSLKNNINEFFNRGCNGKIIGSLSSDIKCNYNENSMLIYNLFQTINTEITLLNKNIN